jgi:hypothetical protein
MHVLSLIIAVWLMVVDAAPRDFIASLPLGDSVMFSGAMSLSGRYEGTGKIVSCNWPCSVSFSSFPAMCRDCHESKLGYV